jgi:hypothetical protein
VARDSCHKMATLIAQLLHAKLAGCVDKERVDFFAACNALCISQRNIQHFQLVIFVCHEDAFSVLAYSKVVSQTLSSSPRTAY